MSIPWVKIVGNEVKKESKKIRKWLVDYFRLLVTPIGVQTRGEGGGGRGYLFPLMTLESRRFSKFLLCS